MLKRFSLYGFLKNQQYYDYFLLLAFRQMGLSYFLIGLLIAFREIMINLIEIPTGAIADLWGRRRSMILSFAAYIVSFAIFGLSGTAALDGKLAQHTLMPLLFLAMVFFAIGDAFRTGTHKAMIFTWLRIQGRTNERTRIYGYTRSWSKTGSAVSVILACFFVFLTSNFIYVFFFAIIPYILNIINFLGYPKEVDGDIGEGTSIREMVTHLKETLLVSVKQAILRRLILESMGFEGFFKASKDYLQPILMAASLPLTVFLFSGIQLTDEQKSVVLIGPVFFVLFILSAVASRNAYRLVDKTGQEDRTARLLWGVSFVVLLVLFPAMYYEVHWIMIAGFVGLYVIQNIWRPVLISRFDAHSDEAKGATVLSIESQAKSSATMIIAPVLGLAIDLARDHGVGASEFWPMGVLGAVIAIGFFLTARKG
ncbi:MAG: MFS transporter [Deltaproteobacteria bacterium]|nr:MFS transporter [Deltaproteobacteria bacterium]MBW1908945.1 MFS transporter [Deltaproteobacteria bacterium]MBW2034469.1 MFS transporter [Deltaproteobacteria bacterium]